MKIIITKTTYENGDVYYYADTNIPFSKIVKEEDFEVKLPDDEYGFIPNTKCPVHGKQTKESLKGCIDVNKKGWGRSYGI